MNVTNELHISGKDRFGRREDLSFIVRFQWKTPDHLKEAIQVLLAARLADNCESSSPPQSYRRRTEFLDEREFEQIRMQIAANPNTPPAVLAYLVRTASERVLERIAENPQTPPSILESLASHCNADIRAALGDNINTPVPVLARLVQDTNPDVRYRLAENAYTPAVLLDRLSQDSNPYVAARAASTAARMQSGRVVRAVFGERAFVEDFAAFDRL